MKRKSRKKAAALLFLLAGMLCLGGRMTTQAANSRKISKSTQHEMYQATIRKYDRKMKQGAEKYGETGQATYYVFADIDKNGIDELILRYESPNADHRTSVDSGYGESTYIYTIVNKKVKTVLSSGGYNPWFGHANFVRIYKGSSLINRGFSHEPQDDIFYRYRKGKLSKKSCLTVTAALGYLNGRQVGRQKCEAALRKATKNHRGYRMKRWNHS